MCTWKKKRNSIKYKSTSLTFSPFLRPSQGLSLPPLFSSPSTYPSESPPLSYLQCFSSLLLSAIFSPTSVQTGWVRAILAKSALTALTRPPIMTLCSPLVPHSWLIFGPKKRLAWIRIINCLSHPFFPSTIQMHSHNIMHTHTHT